MMTPTLLWLLALSSAQPACVDTRCLVDFTTLGAQAEEMRAWGSAMRYAVAHDEGVCASVPRVDAACLRDDQCLGRALAGSRAQGLVGARAIRVGDQLQLELTLVEREPARVIHERRVVDLDTFVRTPSLRPSIDPTARCNETAMTTPPVVTPPVVAPVTPPVTPPVATTPTKPIAAAPVAPSAPAVAPVAKPRVGSAPAAKVNVPAPVDARWYVVGGGAAGAALGFATMAISAAVLENQQAPEGAKTGAFIAGHTGMVVGTVGALVAVGALMWPLFTGPQSSSSAAPPR
jgi:hypothetical protein